MILSRRGMLNALDAFGANLCLGRLESAGGRETQDGADLYGCLKVLPDLEAA